MNKVECESCVKRKTMYCPNSFKCYATKDKPYWQNRIMLLEENNQLKEKRQEFKNWLDNQLQEYKETEDERGIVLTSYAIDKLNELEGGKNE